METEERDGIFFLRLFGEFDLTGHEKVDAMLSEAQTDSNSDVCVDLRGLTFIDSSGIRTLLNAKDRAESLGGRFRLIHEEPVMRVFRVAGLEGRFEIWD